MCGTWITLQPRECSFREQATQGVDQTNAPVVVTVLLSPLFVQGHEQDSVQPLVVPSNNEVVKKLCNCLVQLQVFSPPKFLCAVQGKARSFVAVHQPQCLLYFPDCEGGVRPLADMGSYLRCHKVRVPTAKHLLEVFQECLQGWRRWWWALVQEGPKIALIGGAKA